MITPLFAEMNGLETGGLIVGIICSPIAVLIALIALLKKQDTQIANNPLDVNIVKALHEQFASKTEFKEHVLQDDIEIKRLWDQREDDQKNIQERLDLRLGEMQKSAEEGREKLHKRINLISLGVARLCGALKIYMPKEDDEI